MYTHHCSINTTDSDHSGPVKRSSERGEGRKEEGGRRGQRGANLLQVADLQKVVAVVVIIVVAVLVVRRPQAY